jgi:hypothetical protein
MVGADDWSSGCRGSTAGRSRGPPVVVARRSGKEEEHRTTGGEDKEGTFDGWCPRAPTVRRRRSLRAKDREVTGWEIGPAWPPKNSRHLRFSAARLEAVNGFLDPSFGL